MNDFKRIAAGNYRHDETGIEIVCVTQTRRWNVITPKISGVQYEGSMETFSSARYWVAPGAVQRMRAAIAKAWAEAHAENGRVE